MVVFDEDRIKGLIKRLITQKAFSLTALSGFMREVTETALPTQYWHKIFDDFGATIALKKEIAPPMMIKLLTLRCLAIPTTEREFMNWMGQNSSPLTAEIYNNFRENLIINLSSYYGRRFDLFSLDHKGKPIPKNFSAESYQVFINKELILEKQGQIIVIHPTRLQLEVMQNALDYPELVKDEVKIVNQNKIVYWVKSSEVCVNMIGRGSKT